LISEFLTIPEFMLIPYRIHLCWDERGTSPLWMIKPGNLFAAVEDQC
jgi:hypothetical protein